MADNTDTAGIVKRTYAQARDAIVNVISGQGTGRDANSYLSVAPVTLTHLEAVDLYSGYWLARKIIDIPVSDMLKNGRTFNNMDADKQKLYEKKWRKFKLNEIMATALKWGRLFGGAGIIPVFENYDLSKPFNPALFANNLDVRFIVIDAHELKAHNEASLVTDLTSPNFRKPDMYQYQGTKIHVSNIIFARGVEAPRSSKRVNTMQTDASWDQSMLLYAKEPIVYCHSLWANIASMVAQNASDILKTPGLYESLLQCADATGQAQVASGIQGRAQMYALYKGQFNVTIIDAEESIERLTYDFTSLPQLISEYVTAISGLSDIPLVRLSGISPGGLSNTGETNLVNYYDGIAGQQNQYAEPVYTSLDTVFTLMVFGESQELEYDINPPNNLSTEAEVEIESKRAETLKTLSDLPVPESVLLRRVQRDHLPEIPDEYIADIEKEERDNT